MILDGVAAFKFLFDGQPKHFFAVLRAHFNYYAWLPRILAERKRLRKSEGFKFTRDHIYKGNVVIEYFLHKKKYFSDLHKGFFSE